MESEQVAESLPNASSLVLADPASVDAFVQALDREIPVEELPGFVARSLRRVLGLSGVAVYRVVAGGLRIACELQSAGRLGVDVGPAALGELAAEALAARATRHSAGPEGAPRTVSVPVHVRDAVAAVLVCTGDQLEEAVVADLERVAAAVGGRLGRDAARGGDASSDELTVAERERRLDALGDLAGGIAHDFNNALTSILGNVSLARLHGGISSPVDRLLAEAEVACLRARRLTRQLLTFAGGGEPIRRPTELGALVREVVRDLGESGGVSLSTAVAEVLPRADIDEDQVRQALHYLIEHALALTQPGASVVVRVQPRPLDDRLEVVVQHGGPEFSATELQRLFDPFAAGHLGPRGLGLSVAHSIVRRHGGRITAEREPGTGLFVFRVALPVAGSVAAAAGSVAAVGEPALRGARGGPVGPARHRILLMDDDQAARTSLARMLRHLGQEVAEAEDGADALERWREAALRGEPFDLAVMDLTVPHGMGGCEAVARLKRLDPDARAIVVSGYSKDPVLARHRDHGFDDVLEKPCELGTLESVLRRVLEH